VTLNTTVEFLPMNLREIEAVAALEACVQQFPWSAGNFADSIKAGHSCWVIRVGGDLVGFHIVMPVLDEAHLLNLAIAPAQQGQGLGARLLRQAMATARENGAASMLLEVRPSNEQAVKLYRHFGFQEIGRRRDYYPSLTGREDALVFRKELD